MFVREDEGDGDSRAGAGNTSAASGAGGADCCVEGTVADRISPSSDSRAREKRTGPDTRDDTPRPCRRHGPF